MFGWEGGMRFAQQDLKEYWLGGRLPRQVPPELRKRLSMKLATLAAVTSLEQLRIPPSNNLEKLRGDWDGYFSIRVNQKYRIVFRWTEEGADDVDIIDYH